MSKNSPKSLSALFWITASAATLGTAIFAIFQEVHRDKHRESAAQRERAITDLAFREFLHPERTPHS